MTHQLTSTIVQRMGDRKQGRSRTPDIPDDWEHIPAPGRPVKKKVLKHNHQREMLNDRHYQVDYKIWMQLDTQARLEQWEAR